MNRFKKISICINGIFTMFTISFEFPIFRHCYKCHDHGWSSSVIIRRHHIHHHGKYPVLSSNDWVMFLFSYLKFQYCFFYGEITLLYGYILFFILGFDPYHISKKRTTTINRKKEERKKIRLFGRVGSQHITQWKQNSNKNTKKNEEEFAFAMVLSNILNQSQESEISIIS